MGIEVAKARLAAKPIVAKPNVDCISKARFEAAESAKIKYPSILPR